MRQQHPLISYTAHYSLHLMLWTRQQPLFSSPVSPPHLHYGKSLRHRRRNKNPLFVYYYLLLGTDFIPSLGMLALHVHRHHLKAWPRGLEASKETPRGNQGRNGRENSTGWCRTEPANNPMVAQKNQNWLFPQVYPAPVPCWHLPSQRCRELRISNNLFFK